MKQIRSPRASSNNNVAGVLMAKGLPRTWFTSKRTRYRRKEYAAAFFQLSDSQKLEATRKYGHP